MKNMNTNYKGIINSFVLNTVLLHVSVSRIIKTDQHLEYDMDKHNQNWMTDGTWYNTYICEKFHDDNDDDDVVYGPQTTKAWPIYEMVWAGTGPLLLQPGSNLGQWTTQP